MMTDNHTPENRLDIIIHDRTEKKTLLIEISVPIDNNLVKKRPKSTRSTDI